MNKQQLRILADRKRRDAEALDRVLAMIDSGELAEDELRVAASLSSDEKKTQLQLAAQVADGVYPRNVTTDELIVGVQAIDPTVDKQSLLGAIYRAAKQGRVFRRVSPGVFARMRENKPPGNGSGDVQEEVT